MGRKCVYPNCVNKIAKKLSFYCSVHRHKERYKESEIKKLISNFEQKSHENQDFLFIRKIVWENIKKKFIKNNIDSRNAGFSGQKGETNG